MMPPPEKLFMDRTCEHAGVYDRDKVMTIVYSNGPASPTSSASPSAGPS
jgi:hypothetical protein